MLWTHSLPWYWIVFYGVIHFPSGLLLLWFRLEFMQAASQRRRYQSPAALHRAVTLWTWRHEHFCYMHSFKQMIISGMDSLWGPQPPWIFQRIWSLAFHDFNFVAHLWKMITILTQMLKMYQYSISYFEMECMNINKQQLKSQVSFQQLFYEAWTLWPAYTCPHTVSSLHY